MPPPTAAATPSTVSMYEKAVKIYPRAVRGRFATWRWVLVVLTQAVFYGAPWLLWNDRQAVLFDLAERRFQIFGLVLLPQDFIFLAALLVISALALFFFTALAGRLWCGYACPQTVYTELFLWLEQRIEGDRLARMRLDAAPWSAHKLARKGGKHAAWLALALFTGFSFVGYFTPIRTLAQEAAALAFSPWEWFWVLFYGGATYGNAGFLREQVCKYMCPYARFQSALIDGDSLVIAYDGARGEPRGSRPKKADPAQRGLGSCIDCTLCVQVCPTGIDIRKGLQYECIGCAACIDVCDGVMDKMGYARGLVRYDTQNGLAQHLTRGQRLRRIFRPRVLVYTAVLVLIVLALLVSLALRHPFKVDVVRDRAALARLVDDGQIENVYRLQIMNATEQAQRYQIGVHGLPDIRLATVPDVQLAPAEARWVTLNVRVPPQTAQRAGAGAHVIHFDIALQQPGAGGQSTGGAAISEKSTFVVPR